MRKPYYIICLSNQYYDLPLKTNKHLVMDRLSLLGHKVIFVDPPTRFKFFKNTIKNKKFSFIEKKNENLYVYKPLNLFNFYPFSYLNNLIHIFILRKMLRNPNFVDCKLKIENYKLRTED